MTTNLGSAPRRSFGNCSLVSSSVARNIGLGRSRITLQAMQDRPEDHTAAELDAWEAAVAQLEHEEIA